MADVVGIYLEAGPCAGEFVLTSQATETAGTYVCKGGLYEWVDRKQLHDGALIFKYAGPAPKPGPHGEFKPTQALKGWQDLRKSINRGMPDALSYSQRLTTASLRTLARARKVRL